MRSPAPTDPTDAAEGFALARRIVTAPRLCAPELARARLDGWFANLGESPTAAGLRRLRAANLTLEVLLQSLAEASPYLWDLASSAPDRLLALLRSDPDRHLHALFRATRQAVAAAASDAEAMSALRRMKGEAALLIALADIGGVWPVMHATAALTELADTAIGAALRYLLLDACRRKRIRPIEPESLEQSGGYFVLAMGKMGAFELNYSSDIDLIVLFDPRAPALLPDSEPAPFYVSLTRRLVKLLQERTADGYVFRVDLRLRPDPSSTQIAMSIPAALDYYEGRGQNWERAALIKARPCAGAIAAGEAFLSAVSPFVWRKYLDFAAIADVHAMKRQLHAYRGHSEIAVEGHNIKLGRGGIREIEFFVQTQQLIAGGRNPALRGRATLATLTALTQGGWVDVLTCDELSAAYRFLRMVEHRLQMVADEQTHTLPSSKDALERFARFLGFPDREAFAHALVGHLQAVQRHYARLFEHPPPSGGARAAFVFDKDEHDRETLDRLSAMGFKQPLRASVSVRHWLSGDYRSLKNPLARDHLADLIPTLLEQFARPENPDAAVQAFDRFLGGLHGGVRLLSLLKQNPELVSLIGTILGTAPRLADILAHYPQVMDALLEPNFFAALPDEIMLARGLSRSLEQARSYEEFLDSIRMFGQEHMFLIGARIISGTVSAEQAGEAFARLADVLIRALHRDVENAFAQKHGRLRRQESAILALGRLGGREMTATSDLDLIVIYDFDPAQPESDGERKLQGAPYFARLTQRLINALSARTNYGLLYQVDMRLRPSGRSGPVATLLDSFRTYQQEQAWTWEHMALTRARVVSASPDFARRIEEVIAGVLRRPRNRDMIAADAVEMRHALAAEKGDADRWNLKYAAGGLIDLEFIAQVLQLVHAADEPDILDTWTARVLDKAWRLGLLSTADAEILRPAARLYHDLAQVLRLCLSGPFDPKEAGPGLLRLLARAADVPDFTTLEVHLAETQDRVRKVFERILGT
jgi:[glutamine synthetase] adenylyltransferase / [glutamine synthetase]-adenylyl-L-tyrosine phosphorylase